MNDFPEVTRLADALKQRANEADISGADVVRSRLAVNAATPGSTRQSRRFKPWPTTGIVFRAAVMLIVLGGAFGLIRTSVDPSTTQEVDTGDRPSGATVSTQIEPAETPAEFDFAAAPCSSATTSLETHLVATPNRTVEIGIRAVEDSSMAVIFLGSQSNWSDTPEIEELQQTSDFNLFVLPEGQLDKILHIVGNILTINGCSYPIILVASPDAAAVGAQLACGAASTTIGFGGFVFIEPESLPTEDCTISQATAIYGISNPADQEQWSQHFACDTASPNEQPEGCRNTLIFADTESDPSSTLVAAIKEVASSP